MGEGDSKPPARVRDLPLAGGTGCFPGKSSWLPGGRLQGMVLVGLRGGCTLVELEVAGHVPLYYQGLFHETTLLNHRAVLINEELGEVPLGAIF